MLVTSVSCSGDPGTDTLPPHSQMLSRMVSPGLSWRSPPASSWERAAQCPEISVPAPLTLPWHLTVHTHFLAPVGSACPPSPATRGLSRRGSLCSELAPPRGQSWAHTKLNSRLPEQSSHPSVGTARALAPPFCSCRHACCCLEALPAPQHRGKRAPAQTHPHATGTSGDLIPEEARLACH